MVTREGPDLLQSVLDDLSQPDPYPQTASLDEQDAWMGRGEAESALAGLISTVLAGGRVDNQALDKARALAGLFETRVGTDRTETALSVLAQRS
jgi:hypothetical protein